MSEARLNHPLFVIVGPSGSGKTRVTEAVFPPKAKIITHTTRPLRLTETPGVDYYVESRDSFQALVDKGQLVERDTYHGYDYGVGLDEIRQRTASHPAYAVLTYNGLAKVFQRFPADVIVVFFDVSKDAVQRRLELREQDSQLIRDRLKLYDQEILVRDRLAAYPRCYLLNADQTFEQVVADFKAILRRAGTELPSAKS